MPITCCYGCVPPKRTTTCHFDGTCQEYLRQKAQTEAERLERNRITNTQVEITRQKEEGVRRAARLHKKRR